MKIIVGGSITLADKMLEAEAQLKKDGHQVTLPLFTDKYAQLESRREMHQESVENKVKHDLIRGYYSQIAEGDAFLVINTGRHHGIANYIGGNTFLEMGFAYILRKPIYLTNSIPEMIYSEEIRAMQPIVIDGDYSKIK